MQTKINVNVQKGWAYVQQLSDVRTAGQAVFLVIVLLISWSGIKTIQTNYGLQKQISTLRQQNELQQLENNNLSIQNQYYNTNQYLEVAARQNFGLSAAGEQEIIVPKSVAMAHTVDVPGETARQASASPAYQRNFKSWLNLFLHRQSQN